MFACVLSLAAMKAPPTYRFEPLTAIAVTASF
jgi:hypothetical protein